MGHETRIEEAKITEEPFYLPTGNEVQGFLSAFKRRLPLLPKGPTICSAVTF